VVVALELLSFLLTDNIKIRWLHIVREILYTVFNNSIIGMVHSSWQRVPHWERPKSGCSFYNGQGGSVPSLAGFFFADA